ncbi:hypothetical protein SBA2_330011 [Acidobacteriia bacterium SbA2]|nr:hypothetical protein SBA2_330011 [Acidobacteriia bacterium SbA2]
MLAENRESEWFPLLEKLENVQAGFATEGSPIVGALATLLDWDAEGTIPALSAKVHRRGASRIQCQVCRGKS